MGQASCLMWFCVLLNPRWEQGALLTFVWSRSDSIIHEHFPGGLGAAGSWRRAVAVCVVPGAHGVLPPPCSFCLPTGGSSLRRPQPAAPSAASWSSFLSPSTRSWLRSVVVCYPAAPDVSMQGLGTRWWYVWCLRDFTRFWV